jgi:hypothetical protein
MNTFRLGGRICYLRRLPTSNSRWVFLNARRFSSRCCSKPLATSSSKGRSLTSYPPPSRLTSSAADFCHDLLQDTTSSWHSSPQARPPSLQNRSDFAWSGSSMTQGTQKTLIGAVLFSDLSMAVYNVAFSTQAPRQATRQARYSDRSPVLPAHELLSAHELYSEAVAQFAEAAEASGQPVGDGECWTLAAEALRSLSQYEVPAPVQSINRTHGHLIYEAVVSNGRQEGKWRGDDSAIRRGDVVEWNTVKIREFNGPPGSYMTLGAPERASRRLALSVELTGRADTAVVTDTSESSTPLTDGASVAPSSFRTLEVIEQSAGQAPTRRIYDLAAFSEGSMWIYRPVPMELYVGQALKAEWPPTSSRMQSA